MGWMRLFNNSEESEPESERIFTKRLISSKLLASGFEFTAPEAMSLNFVGCAIIIKFRVHVTVFSCESTQILPASQLQYRLVHHKL